MSSKALIAFSFGLLSTATAATLSSPAAASRALNLRGGATLPEAVLTATGSAATISGFALILAESVVPSLKEQLAAAKYAPLPLILSVPFASSHHAFSLHPRCLQV